MSIEYASSSTELTASFVAAMNSNPSNYSFLHFADGDSAGHAYGWGSREYYNALQTVDGCLASIFNLVETSATLSSKTTIVLTADHGGDGYDHSNPGDPLDYTIPFYAWGVGIGAGSDLYALNADSRLDPGSDQPSYAESPPPIRNGELANLSLNLLGYGPVPGSTIDVAQDLILPEPSTAAMLLIAGLFFCLWPTLQGRQQSSGHSSGQGPSAPNANRGGRIDPLQHQFADHLHQPRMVADRRGADHVDAQLVAELADFHVEIVDQFHLFGQKTDRGNH